MHVVGLWTRREKSWQTEMRKRKSWNHTGGEDQRSWKRFTHVTGKQMLIHLRPAYRTFCCDVMYIHEGIYTSMYAFADYSRRMSCKELWIQKSRWHLDEADDEGNWVRGCVITPATQTAPSDRMCVSSYMCRTHAHLQQPNEMCFCLNALHVTRHEDRIASSGLRRAASARRV